jgi:hypothetical protein
VTVIVNKVNTVIETEGREVAKVRIVTKVRTEKIEDAITHLLQAIVIKKGLVETN